MARPRKNLNDKPSEYIKENFLVDSPEGMAPIKAELGEQKIVAARYIPPVRTIQFLNGRDPGQELHFHLHSATHPLKHYTLYHGYEYTLPEEVIEHLESRAIPQYAYRMGPNGHPEHYTKALKYLYQCKSVKKVA